MTAEVKVCAECGEPLGDLCCPGDLGDVHPWCCPECEGEYGDR